MILKPVICLNKMNTAKDNNKQCYPSIESPPKNVGILFQRLQLIFSSKVSHKQNAERMNLLTAARHVEYNPPTKVSNVIPNALP